MKRGILLAIFILSIISIINFCSAFQGIVINNSTSQCYYWDSELFGQLPPTQGETFEKREDGFIITPYGHPLDIAIYL